MPSARASCADRCARPRTPATTSVAGIGVLGAGHDLDQRGLAGAVFADERMHLARPQIERHPIERAQSGEGLADVSSVEKKVGHVFRGAKRAG